MKPNIYVGVVGSRHYEDYEGFSRIVTDYIRDYSDVCSVHLVSGGARGADSLAEIYANEYLDGNMIVYPPKEEIIESRGFAAAAHARNQQIVNKSDFVIAFVTDSSRGTWDTIRRAIKAKRHVIIIPVEEE